MYSSYLRSILRKPLIRALAAFTESHPISIVLIFSLAILSLSILFIGYLRPFNSDDLYWQQAVRTWRPFSGDVFYFGTKDIFVMLAPIFVFFESLFEPSRNLILFEAWLLTVLTFVSAYFSAVYFLKKMRMPITIFSLSPFIWLASFGYPMVENYLNSDWRTLEVGIAMLTFTFVAAICFEDFKPLKDTRNKILSTLAILYVGLVSYSDPYFLIFTLGPIFIFVPILYILRKISRNTLTLIIGGALTSIVCAKLFAYLGLKAGFHIPTDVPAAFVSLENLLANVASSLHGLLIIFGADFFGKEVMKLGTIGNIFNASLVAAVGIYIWRAIRSLKLSRVRSLSHLELWKNFWAIVMLFVFLVYTSSTLVLSTNYRFFIVFVYCAVIALALTLGSGTKKLFRIVVILLLIVGTCFNLSRTTLTNYVRSQPNVASNAHNAVNYEIINAVKKTGVRKGYTTYWQGNINTYLSKGKTLFLPTICEGGKIHTFRWLIDGDQFSETAEKSFYLFDPGFTAPPLCTPQQAVQQLGKPEKIIVISDKQLLIYPYDIGEKITPFTNFDQ